MISRSSQLVPYQGLVALSNRNPEPVSESGITHRVVAPRVDHQSLHGNKENLLSNEIACN